jgi:Fe2+ transport system protein FeoA
MRLSDAPEGCVFIVTGVAGEDTGLQMLRLGIDEGSRVFVEKNVSGGPVILCKNQLEIAVGREIARAIEVRPDE